MNELLVFNLIKLKYILFKVNFKMYILYIFIYTLLYLCPAEEY